MTKVEKIEQAVRNFSSAELSAFREWFLNYDASVWDRQIEEDIRAGKLDKLSAKALADHKVRG